MNGLFLCYRSVLLYTIAPACYCVGVTFAKRIQQRHKKQLCKNMDTLPPELVVIIATAAPGLFITCSACVALLDDQHVKYDAMIANGYSVTISKCHISWGKNGKFHRANGPAYELIGKNWIKEWYINGKLHRIGGPAVETEHFRQHYENGQPTYVKHIDSSSSQ